MVKRGDGLGDGGDGGAISIVDIEAALVWAFMTEAAGGGGGGADRFLGWPSRSGDGCSMDGERVSGGGPASFLYSGAAVPVDAEALVGAVAGLPRDLARIVAYHARTATRPDWNVAPYLEARDRDHRWHRLPSRRLARPEVVELEGGGLACLVMVRDPGRQGVERWKLWRAGLVTLVTVLEGRLGSHTVTGPAAPAAPWSCLARLVENSYRPRTRLDLTAGDRRKIAEAGADQGRRAELADRYGITRRQVRRIIQTEAGR